MNMHARPTSLRSAFFGLFGAGVGLLLLAVLAYSSVIFTNLGNIEIAIVSRFGPRSFIHLILLLLPVMMVACLDLVMPAQLCVMLNRSTMYNHDTRLTDSAGGNRMLVNDLPNVFGCGMHSLSIAE